jgi:hypothetical protein
MKAFIIAAMRESGCSLNMIILDACRNNPFAASGRSVGGARGLAIISSAPKGNIISLSS